MAGQETWGCMQCGSVGRHHDDCIRKNIGKAERRVIDAAKAIVERWKVTFTRGQGIARELRDAVDDLVTLEGGEPPTRLPPAMHCAGCPRSTARPIALSGWTKAGGVYFCDHCTRARLGVAL